MLYYTLKASLIYINKLRNMKSMLFMRELAQSILYSGCQTIHPY